jgi:hypothetical protein
VASWRHGVGLLSFWSGYPIAHRKMMETGTSASVWKSSDMLGRSDVVISQESMKSMALSSSNACYAVNLRIFDLGLPQ